MDQAELMLTAELAAVRLKEGELERLCVEVERMLEYFGVMDCVDVSDLDPTTHESSRIGTLRSDIPAEDADEATIQSMLDQAGDLEGRLIVIPNVL